MAVSAPASSVEAASAQAHDAENADKPTRSGGNPTRSRAIRSGTALTGLQEHRDYIPTIGSVNSKRKSHSSASPRRRKFALLHARRRASYRDWTVVGSLGQRARNSVVNGSRVLTVGNELQDNGVDAR
ncbi:hypothetical protein TIFTF001_040771 [Ficus carica]|uniref:Uncharacterized protein n=1 Tax=Ficus carica TaxID=3494 RepID=A0AA88CLA7_FICCA|nr:hypothetical protein TIFTF001_040771 [Ficus carica]